MFNVAALWIVYKSLRQSVQNLDLKKSVHQGLKNVCVMQISVLQCDSDRSS